MKANTKRRSRRQRFINWMKRQLRNPQTLKLGFFLLRVLEVLKWW
jgi:hypothetical protein